MKRYLGAFTIGLMLIGTSAWADEQKIEIKEYNFIPASLTIPVGTKVTWVNRDEIPHTIDDSNKLFRSPALDTDESYSYTFTTPGTYQYGCRLHSHMAGNIIVTEK